MERGNIFYARIWQELSVLDWQNTWHIGLQVHRHGKWPSQVTAFSHSCTLSHTNHWLWQAKTRLAQSSLVMVWKPCPGISAATAQGMVAGPWSFHVFSQFRCTSALRHVHMLTHACAALRCAEGLTMWRVGNSHPCTAGPFFSLLVQELTQCGPLAERAKSHSTPTYWCKWPRLCLLMVIQQQAFVLSPSDACQGLWTQREFAHLYWYLCLLMRK